ncbi:MAG: hypothetical protein Q8K98_10405 [Bacteroidota bacterium]|nr:hypothetical protein [Bacteroidota bacterium]
MNIKTLERKVNRLEKEILKLKQSKQIFAKMDIDTNLIEKASEMLFDFDIEKYVSKKDLAQWK